MKPNFIVIGAARSGTTSIFHYMKNHPGIVLSEIKELNFFSNEKYWSKGSDWYERRFKSSKKNPVAIGEASTSYTQSPFSPDVAERIYNYDPDMKLIYIVRDPVERFVSQYLQRTKAGSETREFNELFFNLEDVFYAWQGRYYYQLSNYLSYFDKDQILVISFDEIKQDTPSVVERLFNFLGVKQYTITEESKKIYNAAGKVIRKNKFGIFLLNIYHNHIEQLEIPFTIKKIITKIANIGGTEVTKPVLTDKQKTALVEFYRSDSENLTKEFGIETEQWFKTYSA